MNILLYNKLSDTTFHSIIQPLIKSKFVNHIYIVRDDDNVIKSDKITILSITNKNSKSKLRHIKKLFKGIALCRKHKIDVVMGVLLYPHGYLARLSSFFTSLPLIHITIAGHREFWVFGKLTEKINLLFFRNIKAITVTGEKSRNYLIHNKFKPERVFILPNVIDFEPYYFKSDIKKEYDVVSISRLDKNKNLSLLLRAIAAIKERTLIKALIAGVGDESDNLKQEAKMLGIEEQIHFTGWVEEVEKNDIYNKASIFVLCSKGEGFPLSLLEAMSCGCVSVVSNVGDISDVIAPGKNGFIFNDTENELELAQIIEFLINNPLEISNISHNAQEVKNNLSIDNVSKIWDTILSNINK